MTRLVAAINLQARATSGASTRQPIVTRRGISRVAAAAALLYAASVLAAPTGETPHETATASAEQAAELFRKGLAEYDAHRYREAIDIFSRVYEQTHSPSLLFNIAQSWRLLGDCPRAVAAYDAFIVADPTSLDVDRARDWLTKLRPCREAAAAPESSEPAGQAGVSSPPTPSLTVPQSSSLSAALSLHPTASSGVLRQSTTRPVLAGILGGVAVAFAGTGAYAAWRANDLANQVASSYGKGGTWNGDAAAVQREGERAQTEAIALLSGAILSGVAAYVVHRFAARSATSSAQ